ncbi:serine/threonine-protein kinase 17B [Bombina bombina]|uniref:serine/threonine-protein kinase 17B n=1 Tax=Bombina bombina TaxID=8345 RepID=UPI00235A56A8|nr:serine/threonine-protein kinase 17B [Bombina bombina]XP_053554545.1 serine/threonine-protein kinase 17B [Bombina bombina]XP_053554546.1 serine/threonine-protein kinase 17B [Bombina bombina]
MLRKKTESKNLHGFLSSAIQTSIKTENFYSAYTLGTTALGRGKYAVVWKCIEKSTGKEYAAKFLKKRRRGQDCRTEIMHEIAVLELAKPSLRIVDLYEVYETGHEIILVLEYAAGGEIFNLVVDRDDSFSERHIIRLLRQIIEGVYFLHQNNVVHLDLKPQNILLSSLEPLGNIKIVDFGMSRKIGKTNEIREIMGTPEYVAPEILNYEPITTSTDIWSIGVICYMLLTGESPFLGADKQETFLNISQVNVDFSEDTFSSVSEEAIDFLKSVLVKNPEKRATAEDCLSHPWLQQDECLHYCCLERTTYIFQADEPLKCDRLKVKCPCNGVNNNNNNYLEDKENIPDDHAMASKRFRFDDSYLHHKCL